MGFTRLLVLLLVTLVISKVHCHHHQYHDSRRIKHHADLSKDFDPEDEGVNGILPPEMTEDNKRVINVEQAKGMVPFSARRLEKMLEKAILKIITGDLTAANRLLLKSLNYSSEEVSAIREREFNKRKDEEIRKEQSKKTWTKSPRSESTTEKRKRTWDKISGIESDYSSSSNSDYEEAKHNEKNRMGEKLSSDKDFDFDAYNRQAVLDYENLASKFEFQQSWSDPTVLDYEEPDNAERDSNEKFRRDFDKAMEPHVVFKIRYDDSEFDSSSNSDETGKERVPAKSSKHRASPTLRHATSGSPGSFHASSVPTSSSIVGNPSPHTPLPIVYQLNGASVNRIKPDYLKNQFHTSTSKPPATVDQNANDSQLTSAPEINPEITNSIDTISKGESNNEMFEYSKQSAKIEEQQGEKVKEKRVSEYEGLEWVEDDVYRVIPSIADSLGHETNDENDTSEYEDSSNYYGQNWTGFSEGSENDTLEYQNDGPDSVKLVMANTNMTASNFSMANLSAHQQLALAHRREGNLTTSFDSQGQKAIEDIKSRVLALTGRFNLSTNTNQVQREKLTMFQPTCQIPRNTDPDAWFDPFSMNMHFQLNLTSGDHVVAAKLRIFKLPQENLTSSTSGVFDEDEEDEKKIRISIYYYTKSLKKHRCKKRLMDSVVTPLTPRGTHLALDVRQSLRFWRLNSRNPHGNGSNHGLVIQVEDQDGRPLKPALYIQQPSCAEQDSDQKAYQRIPALFIRACTRYVRVVNGQKETYVNCRH